MRFSTFHAQIKSLEMKKKKKCLPIELGTQSKFSVVKVRVGKSKLEK